MKFIGQLILNEMLGFGVACVPIKWNKASGLMNKEWRIVVERKAA